VFPVKVLPLPIDLGRAESRLLWHERYQKDPAHIWLRTLVERSMRRRSR
jgi:hypothetical protein